MSAWDRFNESVAKGLSRIGFGSLSDRMLQQLASLLTISLLIHVLALALFGSWVVMRALREERTTFVASPPLKTYQPRQLEHKVKVQKRQRSASRPALTPRMVAMKASDFALPEINVNAKTVKTSFQPNFKQVSGVGLGAGLGTGYGLGGFGMGVSQFDFFGIKGRGDRIAILVDVSESMAEEAKGGEKGFARVKRKLGEVVDALSEQALFNVVVFADAASTFKPDMIIGSKENKAAAKGFIQPFNTGGNWGLTSGNVQGSSIGLQARGGTTRLDLALTAAFELNADTILVISDGLPRVQKQPTGDELAAWNARMEAWNRDNAGAMAAHAKAMERYREDLAKANVKTKEVKVWVPGRERREGQAAVEAHWETRTVTEGAPARPAGPQPPQMPDNLKWWSLDDFIKHFTALHNELYVKKGKKLPVVHTIGYEIDKEGGEFLRSFTKTYKGQYRRVGN